MSNYIKIKGSSEPGVFLFYCPGCELVHQVWTTENNRNPITNGIWKFNGDRFKPTFEPSLNIDLGNKKRCHCIITDGNIYYCSDSTHSLVNQTVEIPSVYAFWGDGEKINQYRTEFVHYMPNIKEPGTLYVSYHFRLAIHLCACGCGMQAVTEIAVNGKTIANYVWEYIYHGDDGSSTLHASILNRICKAHYYIQRGKVVWC